MKLYTSLFLLAVALPLCAQRNTASNVRTEVTLVDRYLDSLKKVRPDTAILGSNVMVVPKRSQPGSQYARLFMPLTFYKNVSHDLLTLNPQAGRLADETVNKALFAVYMKRPDLVSTTESKLDIIGPTLAVNEPVTQAHPDLIDRVAPTPIEPDIIDIAPVIHKPNFWTFGGDYYLQFLQNYVSANWYKGGESSYSMVGSITLLANYNNKQKVKWDNKLELKLGLQTSRGDSLHSLKTSEDLIRYTGKLGLQATKRWYYTIQLIAYTQFVRGYHSNDPFVYSDFMSPFNANLSVGMDYNIEWFKKRLTGTIHLAPAAYNFKYVDRLALATRYGLKEGHHQLHDIGSEFTLDVIWKFSDMMSWKSRLYGYTTYKRAEVEWENTIVFKFNKYISSNIFVYPQFDDGSKRDTHHGYWQLKEYASVGFSYNF